MKTEPLLTDFGLGLPYGTKIRHRRKKMKEEKARLVSNQLQFELVCQWLNGVEKTQSINYRHCSYFLKHIAERGCEIGHISNGVFISAAIFCGFSYKKARNHPNVVFNMSQDSIQQKYRDSLKCQKYPQKVLTLVH